MTTPEEKEYDAHQRALQRQWTIQDGRKSDKHIGSWVDIRDVLDKVENNTPLTRTERRVLIKYSREKRN
jgi:hypothetical protein